jgi:LacI family transcriptional regulator
VPDEVALLGYDDFELSNRVWPAISVIQQPIEELGRVAAGLLFEQLNDSIASGGSTRRSQPQQVQLKTRLVRRRSCGCLPPIA